MIGRIRRWRDLPEAERRARLGRRLDLWLRRPVLLRSLAPVPDRVAAFRRALEVAPEALAERLSDPDPRRGPWLGDLDARAAALAAAHPGYAAEAERAAEGAIVPRLETLVPESLDLRGPRGRVEWHRDPGSGRTWDRRAHGSRVPVLRPGGGDIRVLWEVGRFRHLLAAGQAYRLSGDDARGDRLARAAAGQIEAFLEANTAGIGPHWACPMEAALRALAWLALLGLFRGAPGWDRTFVERVCRSLWFHGLHLRRNPELHRDGLATNHHLADMLGLLAVARALPELKDSGEWAALARSELSREMTRQVLPDGVGFERSTSYHRLSAEILALAALVERCAGRPMAAGFEDRLGGMMEFTAACTRPDGTVPRWGDGDDGRALGLDVRDRLRPYDHRHLLGLGAALLGRGDLCARAGDRTVEAIWLTGLDPRGAGGVAAGPPPDRDGRGESRLFADGGLLVMRSRDAHLTASCAPVGTAGLGNHSHNDTLAIALWLEGADRILDPGTGCYGADPGLRNRLRSVAAHATVQVGGREPNDLLPGLDGLFGMRGKARIRDLAWRAARDGGAFAAEHDGFTTEAGRCVHRRRVEWRGEAGALTVSDRVDRDASDPSAAEPVWLRFPLPPGTTLEIHLSVEPAPPDGVAAFREFLDATEPPLPELRFVPAVEVRYPDGPAYWFLFDVPEGSDVAVDEGVVAPRYGVLEGAPVLVVRAPGAARLDLRTLVWTGTGART